MDENKQIEEMALAICRSRGASNGEGCERCCTDTVCLYQEIANALHKAGYRKQSEGEWLVSKTEQAWNNAEYPIERNCSVCGMRRNIETQYAWNYCPNCGAKMKGE